MRTFVIAAALGGTLLAGGTAALAQAPSPTAAAMPKADTDRDGVVTRAEAQAAADARFAALDTNKDGKLTRDDRRAARAGKPRADANGDGALTRAEAMAAAAARFAARDTNGDGTITQEERPAGAHHRRGFGGRGKAHFRGEMTQAQFRDAALRRFDRTDANHDGRVDAREREAAKLLMRARAAGRAADAGPATN